MLVYLDKVTMPMILTRVAIALLAKLLMMVQWLKMYFRFHHFISNVEDWPIIRDDQCPQQSNGVDCGMFVLKYGEHLIKGTNIDFERKNIPRFRGEYVVKVI
ncbi:putative ubiquitin-like-specific protease 1B [Acorus calamus]|uniref:Ubiquitin-like-specific protease 1B n=1 Tax=Acorus calamus TaxID=4465 RepID=A0AAV9C7B8_ACOCL|nr:putative ubiquitin-like-specific protease 1B [Acorus calamus]